MRNLFNWANRIFFEPRKSVIFTRRASHRKTQNIYRNISICRNYLVEVEESRGRNWMSRKYTEHVWFGWVWVPFRIRRCHPIESWIGQLVETYAQLLPRYPFISPFSLSLSLSPSVLRSLPPVQAFAIATPPAPVQPLKSRSNAGCFDARTVIRRDDETVFLLVGSRESSLPLLAVVLFHHLADVTLTNRRIIVSTRSRCTFEYIFFNRFLDAIRIVSFILYSRQMLNELHHREMNETSD